MNIGGQRGLAFAAVIGATVAVTQDSIEATEAITGMGATRGSGAACDFVKPDRTQKFGHVGCGFKVPGTGRWVYGAVENSSAKLYTPPGGDIEAWQARPSTPAAATAAPSPRPTT
ncbi:hypothetical protein ACFYSF_02465 [Streptomyces canus]|uniref:hypothetical protein n=1 Tax=Streptomyces canus TaxID=58343 RepID=UPI0036BCD855